MDRSNHPALLMVDTISSLGSIDYRHDEWGVDVTVAGSQNRLDDAAGLEFQRHLRQKRWPPARARYCPVPIGLAGDAGLHKTASSPSLLRPTLLYGLQEALKMLHEEGCPMCFAVTSATGRHALQCGAWGLEIVCEDPREYSSALTAVFDARRARCGSLAEHHPRKFRHVSRSRSLQICRQVFASGSR